MRRRAAGFTSAAQFRIGAPVRREPGGACDYISGMTDKYAVEQFGELFIPKAWSVK